MKRIFCSPELFTISRLKDLLEQAGVVCVIRNEVSAGLAGGIPLAESIPELWIQEDQDLAKAEAIKRDWQSEVEIVGGIWRCTACSEQLEPQFTSCWKCGAAKK